MKNNQKTILISGVKGQDGSYLSDLMLSKDWTVVGFERHTQNPDYSNIKHLFNNENFVLERSDITDLSSLCGLINKYKPDWFINLAAMSFVGASWNEPVATLMVDALGPLNCLEAIRHCKPDTKFLTASSSEVVGNSKDYPQNEETLPTPRSPYGIMKNASEHMVNVYKESYGLFSCYTRCYNHESSRRGKEFVTRKITDWIGRAMGVVEKNLDKVKSYLDLDKKSFIPTELGLGVALRLGLIEKLALGNLDTSRDWLSAEDCVRAMYMILSANEPDNYVVASGKEHSLREFLTIAFENVGVANWEQFVIQDPKFMRPNDVTTLCGDYSKIKNKLGWEPKISFKEMIKEMVQHDIEINSHV